MKYLLLILVLVMGCDAQIEPDVPLERTQAVSDSLYVVDEARVIARPVTVPLGVAAIVRETTCTQNPPQGGGCIQDCMMWASCYDPDGSNGYFDACYENWCPREVELVESVTLWRVKW